MFENARKFYVEDVLPSYIDYIEQWKKNEYGQNKLLRKGIIICSGLYHIREHLPIKISRKEISLECPDYDLIGDIVNASKHKEIDQNEPIINDASQISESLISVEYTDSEGTYSISQVEVFVKPNCGDEICLTNLITSVMAFWTKKLRDLGIGSFREQETVSYERSYTREEIKNHSNPISTIVSEDYKQEFRFLRFNNQTNKVDPFEIVGLKATLRIPKLPKSAIIGITCANGIKFDHEIPLTGVQADEYIALDTFKEKERYIEKVISDNPKIVEGIENQISLHTKSSEK